MLSRRDCLRRGAAGLAGVAVLGVGSRASATQPDVTPGLVPGRLGFNENPYGPPSAAREVLRRAADYGNRYTVPGVLAGIEDLRKAIAAREGVPPAQVVFGHGSWELLWRIAAVFGRRLPEAVTAEPTFFGLPDALRAMQVPVVALPVNRQQRFDLEAIANRALRQRGTLVLICNPNNPTSTLLPGAALASFCRSLASSALLVIDEAYYDYVAPPQAASMIELVRDGVPLIVLRTFSKMYGMAGLRLGYAVASRDLAADLARWDPGPMNAATVAAAFSELLRYTLRGSPLGPTAFGDEVRAVERYLAVEQIRFEDQLAVEWHVDPSLECVTVPGFVLQPLVENALRHGRAPGVPLKLRIEAVREPNGLLIEVANTGSLRRSSPGTGIGLENVAARLARSAPRASVDLRQEGDWVRASVRIATSWASSAP